MLPSVETKSYLLSPRKLFRGDVVPNDDISDVTWSEDSPGMGPVIEGKVKMGKKKALSSTLESKHKNSTSKH